MTSSHLSREDLRTCVDVVKTIARERGVSKDPAAVAELMTAVARNFNRGIRAYDELVEAIKATTSQGAPGQWQTGRFTLEDHFPRSVIVV